jgi:F-type H+-transporting ATPase subunit gamma
MANVLDLRRRIRSVKNTRQITKAMKMVSAAKLRRAQERALSARPYAKMITSVLESLTRRIDRSSIRRPATCAIRSLPRAKRSVCCSSSSAATRDLPVASTPTFSRWRFSSSTAIRQGDRRRSRGPQGPRPDAPPLSRGNLQRADRRERQQASRSRERKGKVEVTGDHPGMLLKLETSRVYELAQSIISRYVHEEIDAAYIVYNEFKSVIQQRLVVEKLLPI